MMAKRLQNEPGNLFGIELNVSHPFQSIFPWIRQTFHWACLKSGGHPWAMAMVPNSS